MLESVSKWYGEVIGINDVSLAIDGGVTGVWAQMGLVSPHCSSYYSEDSGQARVGKTLRNRSVGEYIPFQESGLCQ